MAKCVSAYRPYRHRLISSSGRPSVEIFSALFPAPGVRIFLSNLQAGIWIRISICDIAVFIIKMVSHLNSSAFGFRLSAFGSFVGVEKIAATNRLIA